LKTDNPVLQVQDLHKKFKEFQIKNVSFSLEAGYIMGFIGRNGSGKTTIMKLIQNVIVKNSGTVTICGYDNRRQEVKAKNEIGFVVDSSPFIQNYSLLENAQLFGKYYSEFDMNRFNTYLNRFRLDGNQRVTALSKGMESRFQLAFALSHNPRLLIMDEPNDGLDPIFRREFLSLLQELIQEERMGILFSTHITSDLDKVADYITLIDKGQVILTQDKETLMERYRIMKGGLELLQRIPADKFIAVRKYREGFEGMTESSKEIMALCGVTDQVMLQRATLDDIMYYFSKRSKNDGQTESI
jgi:ABC-2 type transport system ATP-binding protein